MSAEQHNPSRGWAKHERQRKAEERKIARSTVTQPTITTPEDAQRKFSIASWSDTLGLLNIYTSHMENIRPIYEEIVQPLIDRDFTERHMLREWYSACYNDAKNGNEDTNRSEYMVKHVGPRATDPYDPNLVQRTASLRKLIESFVVKTTDNH